MIVIMLNSRQRAQLRAMANSIDTILQIGKGGITENVITQASDALKAREIFKGRVLESSMLSAREAADELSRLVRAESVQTIGSRFVLYKENRDIPKEKRIQLVK
jgi:RNA-binding protein